jgi:hypothetical protein
MPSSSSPLHHQIPTELHRPHCSELLGCWGCYKCCSELIPTGSYFWVFATTRGNLLHIDIFVCYNLYVGLLH